MAKERWAWPRHSTPTDRPAVERDSRDTGNKVFLLVGLTGNQRCDVLVLPPGHPTTSDQSIFAILINPMSPPLPL